MNLTNFGFSSYSDFHDRIFQSVQNRVNPELQKVNTMANIKEMAIDYKTAETKNVSELGTVNVDMNITVEEYNNAEGEPFTVNTITVNDEKYRVPNSVLKQLKQQLEVKPDLKAFRVMKEGSGLSTQYTVVPL